jgi:hypothetical protein
MQYPNETTPFQMRMDLTDNIIDYSKTYQKRKMKINSAIRQSGRDKY